MISSTSIRPDSHRTLHRGAVRERKGFVPRIVLTSVAGVEYRYELRGGDEVVATGHLSREQPLEVGDRIEVGGQPAIVRAIEPLLGEPELRLVLRLLSDWS
jgi:hypothetical protein